MEQKIAVSLIAFTGFYWAGLWLGWHIDYGWFDKVLHFGGGFLTAAVFIYLIIRFRGVDILKGNFWLELILGLGFVALIAVLWEFHEFAADWYAQRQITQNGVADTMSDLFFDLAGGLTFFISKKTIWRLAKKLKL